MLISQNKQYIAVLQTNGNFKVNVKLTFVKIYIFN